MPFAWKELKAITPCFLYKYLITPFILGFSLMLPLYALNLILHRPSMLTGNAWMGIIKFMPTVTPMFMGRIISLWEAINDLVLFGGQS